MNYTLVFPNEFETKLNDAYTIEAVCAAWNTIGVNSVFDIKKKLFLIYVKNIIS